MPKWENGCIYMLRHKEDVELENIYIGSTTNFRGRKHEHKSCCNNINRKEYNAKKYQFIRANGGWDEWKMIWLEDYPCKNKRELEKKEDEVMLQYQNTMNMQRAYLTDKENEQYKKEYCKNNRDKILEKAKKHYRDNRDKKLERLKEKITCDICGCESTRNHLTRHQRSAKCQSHKK